MSDVELVIRIPENYDLSKIQNGSIESKIVLKAVANGKPLPKGHGRLDDIDKLQNIFNNLCDAYHIDNLAFMSDMDMNFDLDCRPSIIEADTEWEKESTNAKKKEGIEL